MATHHSILAWEIPWREEPGGLQSMRSQRVRHDWVCICAHACTHTHTHTHRHRALPVRSKGVKVKSLSHIQLFVIPWTVAYPAPPSMGFSRQEYWSGLYSHFLSRGLSPPRDGTQVSRIAGRHFTIWATWEALAVRCHFPKSVPLYCDFHVNKHESVFKTIYFFSQTAKCVLVNIKY